MVCEPDRDRQEGALPASNTSLSPSSSAPYRESEDWTLLRQLIKHRAPVVIDIEEPTGDQNPFLPKEATMSAQPILISVILDKSGSMGPKQTDVIGGFNRFLAEQRQVPGRARMIVTQFNSEVTPPTPAVPVEEVLPLTSDTYTPGGNTALFDAIAQTVGRADAEKRPAERVLCLIITDGEENASRETTLGQVKAVISEREARGDWTFAYLGAAPDRWTRDTGMSSGSAVAFRMAEPQASFRLASDATRRLRVSRRQSTRSFFAADESSDADTEHRDP